MTFDIQMIERHYNTMAAKVGQARAQLGRGLTLAEKILFSHLAESVQDFPRGEAYVNFNPDRVAMQDATAQMALLQFMNAGRAEAAVPSTVHCDHLIQANTNGTSDLAEARERNSEVYDFLAAVSSKYGIGFWRPGAGIIHQVLLENYAFPGGMMIGTDSHTPNAGGLGMVAIGVGGADAADVMSGMSWELKMPRVIGVRLSGQLSGWCSPKDVILKLAGILTVKGGTNAIIEYFGPGAGTISATGKATICNMGAEVGATTSLFGYDGKIREYLVATSRERVARAADAVASELVADVDAVYDRIIDIDLSTIEPYINGPFTPDAASPIGEFARTAAEKGYPMKMEVGLIGSCTNSSYEDMSRAASVAEQAVRKGLKVGAQFIVTPGSQMVKSTAERDGFFESFANIGGVVMANACGACIGQWARKSDGRNSIVTSFNRNFAARNDGNPQTYAFVASPELTTALTLAGRLDFNPLTDKLQNCAGEWIMLDEPQGVELPSGGFVADEDGYQEPLFSKDEIRIDPASERLQILMPFQPWDGRDYTDLALLIKAKGKCTTDHISAAGRWLRFRGHLENISQNLLMAATNAYNGEADSVWCAESGEYERVSVSALAYRNAGVGTIVVAEENYGEGSSREHAAMEPRFLGVKVVLAKSFARIHETNLKKQGMLALTFADKQDYDKIEERDLLSVTGLSEFVPDKPLTIVVTKESGQMLTIVANHTYNALQIEWFRAGSALNMMKK